MSDVPDHNPPPKTCPNGHSGPFKVTRQPLWMNEASMAAHPSHPDVYFVTLIECPTCMVRVWG